MHLECGAACSLGGPHFVQKGSMPKKRVPCYKQLPPTARGPGIKEHASPTQEGRASFIYPPFENPSVSWVAALGPALLPVCSRVSEGRQPSLEPLPQRCFS